jgi:ketosteroid isomerase-like protein
VTIDDNKRVVLEMLEAASCGDRERVAELLADGYTLRIVGGDDLPTAEDAGDRKSFFAGPSTHHIGAITAEDDRVCVESQAILPLTDGRVLDRYAHFLFRIKDGKIASCTEYCDTLHIHRTYYAPDGSRPSNASENSFFEPTHTITGDTGVRPWRS